MHPTNELDMVPDPVHGRISSDAFFAQEIGRASNVILAIERNLLPAPTFRTNALSLASAASHIDNGVLRRARPFQELVEWHPLIEALVRPLWSSFGNGSTNQPGKIVIPVGKSELDLHPEPFTVPLNANGTLKLTATGELDVTDDPDDNGGESELPFQRKKIWNLGVAMAAKTLGIDLNLSEVQPGKNRAARAERIDARNSDRCGRLFPN